MVREPAEIVYVNVNNFAKGITPSVADWYNTKHNTLILLQLKASQINLEILYWN
jgi:hypothetical protein